ncbi:2Fe-2S iron-sulfur cluster-binding protein [Flavisphingomonas formosensis]|uniref:2Fe-2S iron-sulfur cluster-binding protein n=1 Tax=Flavisphingomonas formosensis TaxID=861534 RepID=UPI0012FCE287|nr:2Fe-2S iron-sulfur cluster-binding protein [Sphingomonas formosensis]
MTALALLGYISAALLVQVALAIAIAIHRRALTSRQAAAVDPHRPAGSGAAWAGLRAFRVRRRDYEDDALGQCSFYLEPVDGAPLPPYKAGQFLTVQLDLPDPRGTFRQVTRCYSLSDSPNSDNYRITIKRIPPPVDRPELPPGLVSGHFHDHVFPGSIVQLRAPAGTFGLDDEPNVPAVLIAGGIGITPLFAMAREALARQPDRAIHLVYGVRDSRELVFEAAIDAMRTQHPHFRVTIVQSCPLSGEAGGPDCQATGFIDIPLLQRVLAQGRHHFYVCGPPPMMASLVPALRVWTGDDAAVRYEAFGPASLASAEAIAAMPLDRPLAVRFSRSGRTLSWTGEETNLLDFAEHHGVEVESGCRSGSCGTCETTIGTGEVRYAQPPSFEVARGRCLLCVGAPVGDLVLEA